MVIVPPDSTECVLPFLLSVRRPLLIKITSVLRSPATSAPVRPVIIPFELGIGPPRAKGVMSRFCEIEHPLLDFAKEAHAPALPRPSASRSGTLAPIQSMRFSRCSVYRVLTLVASLQRWQSPGARRLSLLRLRFRNRGTCPSRARPCPWPVIREP